MPSQPPRHLASAAEPQSAPPLRATIPIGEGRRSLAEARKPKRPKPFPYRLPMLGEVK